LAVGVDNFVVLIASVASVISIVPVAVIVVSIPIFTSLSIVRTIGIVRGTRTLVSPGIGGESLADRCRKNSVSGFILILRCSKCGRYGSGSEVMGTGEWPCIRCYASCVSTLFMVCLLCRTLYLNKEKGRV
jgi:hypothetical protein